MLLVEAKCLFAVATEVQERIESHVIVFRNSKSFTPPLQEASFGGVLTPSNRRAIRVGSFRATIQSSQQISANGVEQVVAIECKPVDQRERSARPFDFNYQLVQLGLTAAGTSPAHRC